MSVKRIEQAGGKLRVVFIHDGAEQAAVADRVVNGAGRIADVDGLDLAAGNVAHANGRVTVDRYLRSASNPQVHVCGDALPISPQLSPLATYEGDIVGRNIVEGAKHSPDYEGLPTSVYTVPALAAVGLTEVAARQNSSSIDVHVNDMLGWFSARTYAETVSWSKIIVDRDNDRILGAHFVGHEGQELVNVFALAIKFGISATQLKDFVYAYPTFSADIKHMFARMSGDSDTLSIREPSGISFSTRSQRWCFASRSDHSRRGSSKRRHTCPSKLHAALHSWPPIAGSLAAMSAASAGECPAGHMKPNARTMVDYKPVGVTDTTLGAINLEKQPAHIAGRELRFRKLTIEPGGIVPWHSHDDRPALIFVQQGEIEEYASNCDVPIVHKAGEIRPEVFGTSHWWKNLGKETVILYVGDVRKDPADHNM